ncbi:division/cell wall cluster transcriptional repressor MraZ [Faecalicoccus pleomorphus]|uniref:division/cell wall cluster transcriptional repressor MraZ n=1 Tax=Faecalicoccus pleomorphus TaxID=1323 RepID=UPI00189A3E0E|nr:division/cell wall cluster transcriptional repressor MraZ [Faecalicoccus pleomorphus]MDB7983974.1 division/cell wall cluster transcriptional repressor MraZ [Faecalicoccus pleomorphus]
MFMGEYAHNIDRKGRLIMPAKFREDLGEHVVVNRGLDGCLYVYTTKQWETVYQKLSALPSTNKDARMFQRMMLSKAAEVDLDSQGRILIPRTLIELAGLEKECLIVGMANHLEIWSKERWMQLEEEQSGSFEEAAEALNGFME